MKRSYGAAVIGIPLALAAGVAPALAQGSAQTVVRGVTSPKNGLPAYRINPGDEVEIYVWGEDRLSRVVKVLPDGTFSFPLVGQVDAMNKLPHDIEREISTGLKTQFRENVPQVTVTVKAATGLQFSVSGKVKGPGTFTPGRYVNVLEALTMAGGPTDFANVSGITILRKVDGHLTAIRVRLSDVMKGNPSDHDLAGLPVLESGDTVIVP